MDCWLKCRLGGASLRHVTRATVQLSGKLITKQMQLTHTAVGLVIQNCHSTSDIVLYRK